MSDSIRVTKERLHRTLNKLREEGEVSVYTIKIIERYMGGFHKNVDVPAGSSWNAQFGKYLKSHEHEFNIKEMAAKVSLWVDGGKTSSSLWLLSNKSE
ncbi:hypothetical protein [Pectobacterium atrosepticum]|uniref:hypothetical protein n=1 Tax=Pectobacterium atrosepticum TaxID=29471 RepID=UPI0006481374|nr:hypothetical protein [Pectobacterium atrosepticum]